MKSAVLKETADEYILEIQVTQSIRDERKVAKADVAKVERVQADEVAFEAISKLVPAPDLLGANDYALRIAAVEKFLEDHAASDKTKAAKEVLETLKSEAAQVAAGSVKLNGKLISPEEYKKVGGTDVGDPEGYKRFNELLKLVFAARAAMMLR